MNRQFLNDRLSQTWVNFIVTGLDDARRKTTKHKSCWIELFPSGDYTIHGREEVEPSPWGTVIEFPGKKYGEEAIALSWRSLCQQIGERPMPTI